MSRAGYSDDIDDMWSLIRYRGAVSSAIRGKRGQDFLRELLGSLDALPEKKLIEDDLQRDGCFCALGAVAHARHVDVTDINSDEHEKLAERFGIATSMAREIMFENDEAGMWWKETPEYRFERVRKWVVSQLKDEVIA